MADLASRHALPDGTAPRLSEAQVDELLPCVPDWSIENGRLSRDVQVKNFKAAVSLLNAVGAIAEQENHHPDLCIHRWNHLRIEFYTHTVEGLTENDFILAAKLEQTLDTEG